MNNLLNCTNCSETLVDPVLLPCGHTICKSHEAKARDVSSINLRCKLCDFDHEIPSNGFPSNLLAGAFLERDFKNLDLGCDYNEAVDSLNYLEELFCEIQTLKRDPEAEISQTIGELKTRIDLSREIEKEKIDVKALQLIKELNEFETECISNWKKLHKENSLDNNLESVKKEIEIWRKQLDSFKKNVFTWNNVTKCSDIKSKKLKDELSKLKDDLFLSKLNTYRRKQERFCENLPDEPLM